MVVPDAAAMANGDAAGHTLAMRHTRRRSAATARNQTFEAPVPDRAQSAQAVKSRETSPQSDCPNCVSAMKFSGPARNLYACRLSPSRHTDTSHLLLLPPAQCGAFFLFWSSRREGRSDAAIENSECDGAPVLLGLQ